MITSSSSRRRATVKLKGPKRKAPPTVVKQADPSQKTESVFGGGSYRRPEVPQGWAQRHPAAMMFMAVTMAAMALGILIYLIPKSGPTRYETEKKTQPTLSAIDTSLSKPPNGHRSTPTDDSFLDTHYRNSTNGGSGGGSGTGSGGGGGSPGSSSSGKAPSGNMVASASYGDGTVKRTGNNCLVSATGSGNFGSALVDCVNSR
jgi:hypothetical protein